jgi:hypothetical protein
MTTQTPDPDETPPIAELVRDRHPSVKPFGAYFAYDHLAEPLASTSMLFERTAALLLDTLPDSPELTIALRKLLEAKDAAVRAMFDAIGGREGLAGYRVDPPETP